MCTSNNYFENIINNKYTINYKLSTNDPDEKHMGYTHTHSRLTQELDTLRNLPHLFLYVQTLYYSDVNGILRKSHFCQN